MNVEIQVSPVVTRWLADKARPRGVEIAVVATEVLEELAARERDVDHEPLNEDAEKWFRRYREYVAG